MKNSNEIRPPHTLGTEDGIGVRDPHTLYNNFCNSVLSQYSHNLIKKGIMAGETVKVLEETLRNKNLENVYYATEYDFLEQCNYER